jgi:hypothetical protein
MGQQLQKGHAPLVLQTKDLVSLKQNNFEIICKTNKIQRFQFSGGHEVM